MRFLSSLLLLAAPLISAVPINFGNGIFNTPFGNSDTLLKINVDSKCPKTVKVTVTVPPGGISDGALPTPHYAYFTSGTNFGPSYYPGNLVIPNVGTVDVYGGTVGATFTGTPTPDGGAIWTFTNFAAYQPLDAQTSQASGFINGGYGIEVRIVNEEFHANIGVSQAIQIASEVLVNAVSGRFFFQVEQTERCGGDNPPGGSGDPVFSGFQGQHFQFHGLPDEHFNLISSPNVQLNSHFVYLSSGKCDYNDTECFTHPGTYMDVLGLSVADSHVKLVAGTHEAGLRVWVNDAEIQRGAHIRALTNNITSSLRYHHNGRVEIHTDILSLEIANSDMFMNIQAALNDGQLLKVGSTRHTVTDSSICKSNSETHNHQAIESTVAKKYPVTTQLHGLIGQTWRNVKVCARDYMGTVQDYLVSDLFGSDYHYSYFKW